MFELRDVSHGLTPLQKRVYADIAREILAQRFLLDKLSFRFAGTEKFGMDENEVKTKGFYLKDLLHSLRKHPFLLALRRWGRFARRNVCDSATKIPY